VWSSKQKTVGSNNAIMWVFMDVSVCQGLDYNHINWRDSILPPIPPISSVKVGDDDIYFLNLWSKVYQYFQGHSSTAKLMSCINAFLWFSYIPMPWRHWNPGLLFPSWTRWPHGCSLQRGECYKKYLRMTFKHFLGYSDPECLSSTAPAIQLSYSCPPPC
jgi:hypothetical protein